MPSKDRHESQAKQSARFRSEAQKLIDAGQLDPIEADAALDKLVRNEGGAGTRDTARKAGPGTGAES